MNIYADEDKDEVVEPVKKRKKTIPSEYIKVSFSSLGKLDAPEVLHFKDYSMENLRSLAMASEEEGLESLINCLNEMVYEGFDCSYLNQRELLELLYILQGKFYSPYIEQEIYVDPDIEDPELRNSPENVVLEQIPIGSLDITLIEDEFREPFNIVDDVTGVKVVFRLNRIKDVLDAKELFISQHTKEEKLYSPVLAKYRSLFAKSKGDDELSKNNLIDIYGEEMVENAFSYSTLKFMKISTYTEAGCILKYGSKKLENLTDKLEYHPKVSPRIWKSYNKFVEKYNFGLEEEAKFYSTKLQDTVVRRLVLQATDFLPSTDEETDQSTTVQFGE